MNAGPLTFGRTVTNVVCGEMFLLDWCEGPDRVLGIARGSADGTPGAVFRVGELSLTASGWCLTATDPEAFRLLSIATYEFRRQIGAATL